MSQVRDGANSASLKAQTCTDAMILLRQDDIEKVLKGFAAIEQVRPA